MSVVVVDHLHVAVVVRRLSVWNRGLWVMYGIEVCGLPTRWWGHVSDVLSVRFSILKPWTRCGLRTAVSSQFDVV